MPRTQAVNAIAVANQALQTRRNEQVVFLVAGSQAKEQPDIPREPSSVTIPSSNHVVTVPATSSSGCGGDLPPCYVKQRESGGSYTAVNPTGCGGESCGGAWQFAVSTWNDYGGYHYAQDAPPEVQDAKARELWQSGAGCSHWAACG